ncbi:MAG TPA: 2-isopropylmalate synthase, partial [Microbacterium sp.]|nr:2-isopropylmalate synthase [Microbacterium sp.]
WAGDLVFTAFSGSHQDAIKKGFESMDAAAAAQGVGVDELVWAVPYLPIDPKDLGRSYEAVIRVNSQSGKGGVAYLLKTDHALDLPRRLQIEFSGVVQAKTDAEGGEVTSDQIWSIFTDEYLPSSVADERWGRFELLSTRTESDMTGDVVLDVKLRDGDSEVSARGNGNGPVAAFLEVLREQGFGVTVYDYVEHALSAGGDAQAAAYVELQVEGERLWGVGIDGDISTASLKAIVSGVNRAIRVREESGVLAAV